jgi:ABC-2 type transport system ATP-binding protein
MHRYARLPVTRLPAIQLHEVRKRFGTLEAVRGISLQVERGSVCGFLGPNGAGKSTTIRMIMSIILPDEGSIRVLGASALDAKDRIGYLPEERGLYRKMRVGEFLRYMARLKGVASGEVERRVGDWLERLELPGVRGKRCMELSKGMQQKVQLIASVVHAPELLILDEPFSGLDPMNARVLTRAIAGLREAGTTILFSTHQMRTAEDLCDRVVLIHRGEKVLDESLGEIRRRFDPRTLLAEPAGDPEQARSALSALPGVASCAWSEGDRALQVRLSADQDAQEAMARLLSTVSMRRVEVRRTTLDEVFVRLVGGDERVLATQEMAGD